MMLMKRILLAFILILCIGCTSMKVAELNPETGRFPTKVNATVVKSEEFDLDSMKSLILAPDDEFVLGQLRNIAYFDKVMTLDDLENAIIQADLTDEIPSVREKIGINKAYKAYKPFLWLRFDSRKEGNKTYGQFILTKPDTLEDLFIVEKHFDYVWAGVNDQNTWYPMFNALVDYLESNSEGWSASASLDNTNN